MSEQSGLSIFDAAKSSAEATFPLARRGGYDSDAVDAWVRKHAGELTSAAQTVSAVQKENADLREAVAELRERSDAVDKPSYAGLGGHAAQLLQLAEQEAEDVRARAQRDAVEAIMKAEEEANLLRTAATKEAEELRSRAIAELEEKRRELLEEAESKHAEAAAYAEDIRAQAEREADQIKVAAEQDVNNLRQGAERDVEQARAAADREVTEARRVLAVEKERLAREAKENHDAATAQTTQLVSDAETRAAAADERSREVMAQATKARDAAGAEAGRILENARTEASAVVSNAHAEAEHLRATATTEVERQTRSLRSEVDDLQRRREGILAQMGQLRDIVASFAPTAVEAPDDEAPEAEVDDVEEPVEESERPAESDELDQDETAVQQRVED